MENTNIIITNPCNKDWNKMTPKNNGKYCGSCNKTVIDFSTWKKEEILNYLHTKNEKGCGHFKSLQVAVKRPKHHQFLVDLYFNTETKVKAPFVKTLTLSFIVFCMTIVGCNTPTKESETVGVIGIEPLVDTITVNQQDTTEVPPIQGEVEIVNDTPKK